MGIVTMKRSVGALVALALCAVLLVSALPLLASTQIVRDRIALELGEWTGHRVSLGAAPRIDVWPTFRAVLDDVAFHDRNGGASAPVLDADRMVVSLSPLAALRGEVVITAITMHRPLMRIWSDRHDLGTPLVDPSGRLGGALTSARALVAASPANPDASALPEDAMATVEFVDGRIVVSGQEQSDLVTSLTGKIAWPAFNRAGGLTASGIWRGENVTLELSSAQPMLLFAGANAPMKLTLQSKLLNLSLDGSANVSGDGFVDGQGSLATPSLRRLLDWLKMPVSMGAVLGESSLSAKVQGNFKRLRLDGAVVALSGNTGRGVLDVALAEALPGISGTLAFDKLDLGAFVSLFAPPIAGDGNIYDPIAMGFAEQLSLDLRLSAQSAVVGGLALAEVASSVQIKGTHAAFDISDAIAFGGEFQAGLRIDAAGDARTVEMRTMASDVDVFAMARALGAERIVPQGRGNFSAILKGTGRDWNTAMGNAEGSITATLGPGALAGFDIARFRERWGSGDFFPLSDVAGGSLPIKGFDFRAKVTGGVARIEKAEALLEGQVVTITGIVPYFGRALALSGYFASMAANGARGDPEQPFFIGGAWDAPFISPANPWQDYQ